MGKFGQSYMFDRSVTVYLDVSYTAHRKLNERHTVMGIVKKAAASRKSRTRLTPMQVEQLQSEYLNASPLLTAAQVCEMLCKKFNISKGCYYRKIGPARKRKTAELMDTKPTHADNSKVNVTVTSAPVDATPMNPDVLMMGLMKPTSVNYLKGMSLVFNKTEEEILDELVQMALDLGAMEIHGASQA